MKKENNQGIQQIKTKEQILAYFEYLFEDVNGNGVPATLWGVYYRNKNTAMVKGPKGYHFPAAMVFSGDGLKMMAHPKERVTVQLFFNVGGIKYIEVNNLEMRQTDKHYTVADLFEFAALQGGASPKENSLIVGYIEHAFKGQTEPNTYKISHNPNTNFIKVEKFIINGDNRQWLNMSIGSPRIKGIINKFKEQLANDSLQTVFNN